MHKRTERLVKAYKKNYGLQDDSTITEREVMTHWELEKRLTSELLSCSEEERWQTFERAYTTLFEQLPWLNQQNDKAPTDATNAHLRLWLDEIGPQTRRIYEIGSGKCELITSLAMAGHECRATEITRERGQKHLTTTMTNLSWNNTDGINLGQFEDASSYDVVISSQVLEHMHPDDLIKHFEGVLDILKAGGRYIFTTPHRYSGPHDISRLFNEPIACGMHLKEYIYPEIVEAARIAGFANLFPAFCKADIKSKGKNQELGKKRLSRLMLTEKILGLCYPQSARRNLGRVLNKLGIFPTNIALTAYKAE